MRQDFAQPTREEVPPVTRPDPLGVEALDQLPDDCFNASSLLHQKERPTLLLTFGRTIRNQKAQSLFSQLLTQGRTPVVAISQRPAARTFKQALGHRQLVHMSWGQVQPDDHSRPTDSEMCSHAEEGLMSQFVVTVGCHLAPSATPRSARKAADRDRKTVNQRDRAINFEVAQKLLPEPLFDSPQIGRLPGKSRA